ncbi:MAG: peptidyl-prolyl cis-trans isomerase [Paracoccus sp. (in: a-proteobacteria)]
MADRPEVMPKSKLRAIVASPLLHFFVIGGLIFGIYQLRNPASGQPAGDVLRLSEGEAQRLTLDFISTRQRAPTPAELRLMIREWAVEEASVREALALGLDQGDTMIRNRLRNKLEFLAEAPAAALTPDDATLDTFYRENAARFNRDARLSFAQVLLPPGAGPEQVQAVRAELEQGADPAGISASTMLPAAVDDMASPIVEQVFGKGFSAAVAALPEDQWSGPVESGFGAHLVRLDRRSDGALPPFDTVRDRVLAEWRSAEARRLRDAYIQQLLAGYSLEPPVIADETPP